MIEIDGSFGEGGGQILRTSLALSLATGRPFHIRHIRASRSKPGLRRQHLAAARAAAEIGRAETDRMTLGSGELTFVPTAIRPGWHHFSVGTAGSATLVLQTVLPALLTADGPSSLTLEGGTHNPFAPPFDFLARTFLALVNRMGPAVAVELQRPGFYPAGGGRFTAEIEPAGRLEPLALLDRGRETGRRARAMVSALPVHIAERELRVVSGEPGWAEAEGSVEIVEDPAGPGNVLLLELGFEHVVEVFTGFGRRGVRAEAVAGQAAAEAREYLDAGAPAGPHLADQLVVPLALAGGGSYRTVPLTEHARTNIEVVRAFLPVDVGVADAGDGTVVVEVRPAG
ncbi:MAG: RNA 3'-terminal phosphate cyclase [Planctomycetota bacterium]